MLHPRDQARGDGIAFLRRRRAFVVAVTGFAVGVEHTRTACSGLDLGAGAIMDSSFSIAYGLW